MPVNNSKVPNQSRREFIRNGSLASAGLLMMGSKAWSGILLPSKPDSKFFGVQIGVITYSFRSMPATAEQLLKFITDSGISAIELMGEAIEDYAGKPVNPVKMPPYVPEIITRGSW